MKSNDDNPQFKPQSLNDEFHNFDVATTDGSVCLPGRSFCYSGDIVRLHTTI